MFGTGKPMVSYTQQPQKSFNRATPMELDQAEARKKYQRSEQPRKKVTCYNCEKLGHIARECRGKQKAKVSVLEEQASTSDAEFIHIEDNKEQLLRFNGKINGRPAWILLDSGASRNFVSKKFARRHHLTQTPTAKLMVELADGWKTEVESEIEMCKLELSKYRTSGITAQVI